VGVGAVAGGAVAEAGTRRLPRRVEVCWRAPGVAG